MNKYIDKIQRFLNGRYGTDDFYKFLLKSVLSVLIITLIYTCVNKINKNTPN